LLFNRTLQCMADGFCVNKTENANRALDEAREEISALRSELKKCVSTAVWRGLPSFTHFLSCAV
jgi:hypothetical protein